MADGGERPVVGAALRSARLRAGLSQEELAERAGISARSVSDLERDLTAAPRASTVSALAAVLGVDVRALGADRATAAGYADAGDRPEAAAFAELLRAHRQAAGMTQRDLARAALVSERTVSDLERGFTQSARHTTAVLLADGLSLDGLRRAAFLAAATGVDADAGTGASADGSSPGGVDPSTTSPSIPAPLTPLFGRSDDIEAVLAALDAGRLVTIVGPGGVGKTRLAIAVAQRATADRRVVFAAAATANGPGSLLAAIADALGIREAGGVALDVLVSEQLRDVGLLVVDNVEQVIDAAAELLGRILATTSVSIIVTSRVRMRIAGEQVVVLDPLPPAGPTTSGLDPSPADDDRLPSAVRLFLGVSAAERPGWTPTRAELSTIAAVCDRVDGLPLAIELSAAWARMLSPAQILERLDEPRAVLRGGRRDMPDRHRALEATVAGSVDLLTEPARRVFRELSVLEAPFSLDLAIAVSSSDDDIDVAERVAELVDGSLLRARSDQDVAMYATLATVRELARAELIAAGELAATHARFTAAIVRLAETAAPHLIGSGQQAWLGRLERDHHHLRAAVELAVDAGDTETAARLGAALWRYWYIAGHFTEGVALLSSVLSLSPADDLLAGATARYGFATLRYLQGDVVEAQREYRAALDAYRRCDDAHGISATLSNLGMIEQYRGEFTPALELFTAALDEARARGAARAEAVALSNLAALASDIGDVATAEAHYRDTIRAFHALGDVRAEADAAGTLARLSITQGELDRAERLAADTLATFEEQGDQSGVAESWQLLGRIAMERGDDGVAVDRYRAALERSTTLGDRWGAATCRSALALVDRDPFVAEKEADEAVAVQRELEHYHGLIDALVVCVELARRRGDRDRARERLSEAISALAGDDATGAPRLVVMLAALDALDPTGSSDPAAADRHRLAAAAAIELERRAGRVFDRVTRERVAELVALPDVHDADAAALTAAIEAALVEHR